MSKFDVSISTQYTNWKQQVFKAGNVIIVYASHSMCEIISQNKFSITVSPEKKSCNLLSRNYCQADIEGARQL